MNNFTNALLLATALALNGTWSAIHAEDATHPATPSVPAAEPTAAIPAVPSFLRPGEVLTFRLSYGILSNAGDMRIETLEEDSPEGPRIRVKITTVTRGIADSLYTLNNNSSSLIDAVTLRPLQIDASGASGSRQTDETTVFDYAAKTIVHTDRARPERSGTIAMPDQPVYDIMVMMLGSRTWGMKEGETKQVLASFGSAFYDLKITAIDDERIKTGIGKLDTVVLEPRQQGELKGMFRKGGGLKFYISSGDTPQVARVDIKIKVGTIVCTLHKVEKVEKKAAAAVPVAAPAPVK